MARSIPIALQLYSVHKDCQNDFPAVLKAVAKMGYAGVEFAGYHNLPAPQLRTMLDDLGLKAAGTHTSLATLQGDQLAKTIEYNQAIGNRYLIVPGLPKECTESPDAWRRTADTFNAIAEKLSPHGMQTGYHNHHTEFTAFANGQIPWDIFVTQTRPDVIAQLDTGNALVGGGDPVALLGRYPGRAVTIHLKEFSKSNPTALITDGDVNWPAILKLCQTTAGTQWYIVEYEHEGVPALQAVELCLQKLRKLVGS